MADERSLRDEFTLSRFGLGHRDQDLFVKSEWSSRRWVYVVWRSVWLICYLAVVIASGVDWELTRPSPVATSKWFIRFSHWTLVITVLACGVDFISTVYFTAKAREATIDVATPHNASNDERTSSRNDKDDILFQGEFMLEEGIKQRSTPWFINLAWLLYNVINSVNIINFILFWAVDNAGHFYAMDITLHAVNLLFVVTNLLVTAMPVQILHVIYPVIYASIYVIFTAVYFACGGTDVDGDSAVVLTGLDWSSAHPTVVTVIVGLLVIVPLGHLVTFTLYTIRVYLRSKFNSSSYSTSNSNALAVVDSVGGGGPTAATTTTTTTTTTATTVNTHFNDDVSSSRGDTGL